MKKNAFLLFLLLSFGIKKGHTQNNADEILGKWINAANDVKVEVFKTTDAMRQK